MINTNSFLGYNIDPKQKILFFPILILPQSDLFASIVSHVQPPTSSHCEGRGRTLSLNHKEREYPKVCW
jgi:hypothetical protein